MLAIVKERPEPGVALREVPEVGRPKYGEVRIRVEACGLCGTDTGFYEWHDFLAAEIRLPVILGHEVVGIVEEAGDPSSSPFVGQRVATETSTSCGYCQACARGLEHLCEKQLRLGQQIDGGLTAFIVVPTRCIRIIPQSIPAVDATLIQTMAVSMHALEQADVMLPGSSALIYGPGAIGALTALILRGQAVRVAVVGLIEDERRLSALEELGVTTLTPERVHDWSLETTGGFGADISVIAAGSERAIREAIAATRPGGNVVIPALAPAGSIHWTDVTRREIRVIGAWRRQRQSWARAIEVSRREPQLLGALVGMRVGLSETVDALEALRQRQVIKAVVVMDGS